jgi:S1-C subfamily serine protease
MKKYGWLIAILGVAVLGMALVFGAAFGAGLTYFFLHADPVQAALAAPVAVDESEGVLISVVNSDSAAAEAGLVRGDIILEINGDPVNSLFELKDDLGRLEPGDSVELTVLHGDETRTLAVELDDMQGVAYLGVSTCDIPKSGPMFDIQKDAFLMGAEIVEVIAGSPAEEAGLQVGDLILSVGEDEIGPQATLADLIQAYQPGDEVTFKVQSPSASGEASGTEVHEVIVTLGENPDHPGQAYLGVAYQMGMSGLNLGDGQLPFGELPKNWDENDNNNFHSIPDMPNQGEEGIPHFFDLGELPEGVDGAVIISEVMEDTPAADAGLQPGDLIIAVDDEAVTEIEPFVATLQSHKPGDEVTLTIIRNGEESQVAVTLAEHPDNPEQGFLGVLAGTFTITDNTQLPEDFDQNFEFEIPGVPGGDA